MANTSGSSSEYGQPNSVFLDAANDFFLKYGLDSVDDLSDISASHLISVYELIFGHDKNINGIIRDVVTREDDVHNVQCLIDCLGTEHLHCELSHISAANIVDGDVTSIKYLMELFIEVESLIMAETGEGSELETGPLSEGPDDDFLTKGTIDTISQVLQEEGIQSPPTRDIESETSFRSGDSKLPSSISGDLEQHEFESDVSIDSLCHMRGRPTGAPTYPRQAANSPGTVNEVTGQADRRRIVPSSYHGRAGGGIQPSSSHQSLRAEENGQQRFPEIPQPAVSKASTYLQISSQNLMVNVPHGSGLISGSKSSSRPYDTGGVTVHGVLAEPTDPTEDHRREPGDGPMRGIHGSRSSSRQNNTGGVRVHRVLADPTEDHRREPGDRPVRGMHGSRSSSRHNNTGGVRVHRVLAKPIGQRRGDGLIRGEGGSSYNGGSVRPGRGENGGKVSPDSGETSETLGSTQELIRLGDEAIYGKSASLGNAAVAQYLRKGTGKKTRDRTSQGQSQENSSSFGQSSAENYEARRLRSYDPSPEEFVPMSGRNVSQPAGTVAPTNGVAQTSGIRKDIHRDPGAGFGTRSNSARELRTVGTGPDLNADFNGLSGISSGIRGPPNNDPIVSSGAGNVRFISKESHHPRTTLDKRADIVRSIGPAISQHPIRQHDQSRQNVTSQEHARPQQSEAALRGDAFPYTASASDDRSHRDSFRSLQPTRDISPGRLLPREKDVVSGLQTSDIKDSTCSSFSSAAWPEPPPPSSQPQGELASLGTGLRKEDHHPTGLLGGRRMTQHTHTHHHYHQPVAVDGGHPESSQALGSSLPPGSGVGQPLPSVPSTIILPVVSASAPTSPVGSSANLRYPSRKIVPSSTPPRHQPEKRRPSTPTRPEHSVHPERKTKPAPSSEAEQTRRQIKSSKMTKSRSWEEDGVIRKEKLDRALGSQKQPSKSRSFDDVAGPSNVGRSPRRPTEPAGRPARKVAFRLRDSDSDSEEEKDDLDRLAEIALLQKLRNRFSSSSDDGSDSDISVHSDSIIDYSRGSDDPETPKRKPRLPSKKPARSKRLSPVSGSVMLGRSPQKAKPPRVRFEEALDSKAKGSMGKIRREVGQEKKRQDIERKTIEFLYSAGLRELQRDMDEQDERRKQLVRKQNLEYKRKVLKKPKASLSQPAKKYAPRLVPSVSPKRNRQAGQRSKRKRSPSPRIRRQKRLTVEDDDVLPLLMTEFPFLHVSPETAHTMWTKQLRQVEQLTKIGVAQSRNSQMHKKIEDAEQRQKLLMGIMKKELSHNQRMKELRDKKTKKIQLQRRERERRHVTARARRYYDEFGVQSQARMAKKKSKEEKIFKNLFDDALKIQKSRILELRKYARDKKNEMANRQQDEIESMENHYHDQFDLLAEALQKEKRELAIKDTAQAKVLEKMKRSMRRRMEDEIRDYQDQLYRDEDSAHYRGLDAERIKQGLRDAAYKTQL